MLLKLISSILLIPHALSYEPDYVDGTLGLSLDGNRVGMAQIISNDDQIIYYIVDTTTSDFIINSPGSCDKVTELAFDIYDCDTTAVFYTGDSNTFKLNGTKNWSNDFSSGHIWATDWFDFDDAQIPRLSFTLTNETTDVMAQLGIGMPGNELTNTGKDSIIYPNLPIHLKNLGKISRSLYSIAYNNILDDYIIFGGVDHSRFTGNFTTMNITNDKYIEFESQELYYFMHETPTTVINDTITLRINNTLDGMYFPSEIFDAFVKSVGGDTIGTDLFVFDNLDYNFGNISVSFRFGDLDIDVFPELYGSNSINITRTNDDVITVGTEFLNAGYVVVDFDANTVSIAAGDSQISSKVEAITKPINGVDNGKTYKFSKITSSDNDDESSSSSSSTKSSSTSSPTASKSSESQVSESPGGSEVFGNGGDSNDSGSDDSGSSSSTSSSTSSSESSAMASSIKYSPILLLLLLI